MRRKSAALSSDCEAEVLGIYHRHQGEFLSVLKTALLLTSQYEVVPEIIECFDEQALRFLRIFGGRVIHVPPMTEILEKMRQVAIWLALRRARDAKDRERVEKHLAVRMGMRRVAVRRMAATMDALLANLAIEFRPRRKHGAQEDQQDG